MFVLPRNEQLVSFCRRTSFVHVHGHIHTFSLCLGFSGIRTLVSGIFVPKTIRSLEHSFPGPFVPWNFRSRYPGPGAAEGKEKWGSNTHPWRAREREPIMGVWGRSPSGGPGGRAPGGGQRAKRPPAAEEVFVFKMVIFNAYTTVLHEMMYCLSCFFCKVSK